MHRVRAPHSGSAPRTVWLVALLLTALTAGSAEAATYLRTDGLVVDPIRTRAGDLHPYAGVDLAPSAMLEGALLGDAALSFADLAGANLNDADLFGANLADADLRGASLAGATLQRLDAVGADFTNASLRAGDLSRANLTDAHFEGADLSGTLNPTTGAPRLTNLRFATFVDARFDAANLDLTDFGSANLDGASLVGASMGFGSLSNVSLFGADLRDAVIGAGNPLVSFNDADLRDADLRGARLRANFSGSNVGGADFRGVDLSGSILLGSVFGPAIYDATTVFDEAWSGFFGSTRFDPVAAGWSFVPEPGTGLLVGLGLAGLARGGRSRARLQFP